MKDIPKRIATNTRPSSTTTKRRRMVVLTTDAQPFVLFVAVTVLLLCTLDSVFGLQFHNKNNYIHRADPHVLSSSSSSLQSPNKDSLKRNKNKKIDNVQAWDQRRQDILEVFRDQVYGRVPDAASYNTSYRVIEKTTITHCTDKEDDEQYQHQKQQPFAATRYRIEITLTRTTGGSKHDNNNNNSNRSFSFPFVLYVPLVRRRQQPQDLDNNDHEEGNDEEPTRFSTFLLIVNRDKTFLDPSTHLHDPNHEYWPVRDIVNAGFATAAFWAGDVDPDDCDDTFRNGIHPLFDHDSIDGKTISNRTPSSWGAIAAWAFGASRILDYLVDVHKSGDIGKVAIIGHSRGGKTALWAAAQDERFAMAVSNNSGCTGAALSKRKQDGKHGETVTQINTVFPNWFCENYRRYNNNNNNEYSLPVDQHMLLASIAPRPLCVASATNDDWADPVGEYISTRDASPVWSLYDEKSSMKPATTTTTTTLPECQPPPDTPLQSGRIQYHLRTGDHDLLRYDWEQYMKMGTQFLLS